MHQKLFFPAFNFFGVHHGEKFSFTEVARGDLNGDANLPEMRTSDLARSISNFINNPATIIPRNLKDLLGSLDPGELKMLSVALETGKPFVQKIPFLRIFITRGRMMYLGIGDSHNRLISFEIINPSLDEIPTGIIRGCGNIEELGYANPKDFESNGMHFVFNGETFSAKNYKETIISIPISVDEYNKATEFMQKWLSIQ